jgi:hypothetical protein
MLKRRDERINEAKARNPARPVLRGTALPGNAWDDYLNAMGELAKVWPDLHELADLVYSERTVDDDEKKQAVEKGKSTLEILWKGTRRAEAQYPNNWNSVPVGWQGLQLSTSVLLCRLAIWKSQLLAKSERRREAAETLLDLCQFGRDGSFNSFPHQEGRAVQVAELALKELHQLICDGQLSSDVLKQVAHELEILDRSYPSHAHTIMNETLWVPQRCMEVLAGHQYMAALIQSWRYGFSVRLMLTDLASYADEVMKPAAETDSMSWNDARIVFQKIRSEIVTSNKTFGGDPGTYTFGMAADCRSNMAHIRLIRIACEYLASGEVLPLADPFGSKMRWLIGKDGRLKVWSLGADGVDNGGAGSWTDEEPVDLTIECLR